VEEKGALNNFYLPLPVKRKSIVAGRFIFSIVMGLSGLAVSIPLMLFGKSVFAFAVLRAGGMVFVHCCHQLFVVCASQPIHFPHFIQNGVSEREVLGIYIAALRCGNPIFRLYGSTNAAGKRTLAV